MTAETWLSIIAIVISVFSIILQYMVEGPKVDILNDNDIQQSLVRPHSALPKTTQDRFPDVIDQWTGYALVKLVYSNSGDRAGIASIKSVSVRAKNSKYLPAKVRYESYALVPAYEILEQEILLTNIPLLYETPLSVRKMELEIEINIEWGGYHPRTSKYRHKATFEKTLTVTLAHGSEDPPPPTVPTVY